MKELTSLHFAKHFKDITSKSSDERFCFILGSGASFQSGIPTGGQLAKKWLDELKHDYACEDIEMWISEAKINEKQPGEYYAEIFRKRFEIHPQEGYDELNRLMERVVPSFGYSVLSQLLEGKNNVIITTNFDNLTEEALFTFSTKRPLVCGHEYLAPFAKISEHRPLIIKIHRDRQFNPLNSSEETDRIKQEWIDVLNNIFSQCIPVFIGYGGNDGSLMNYLKEIRTFKNLFWCDLNESVLKQDVKQFIIKHKGKFVKIDGFDELMFDIFFVLNLPFQGKALVETASKRSAAYENSMKIIQEAKSKSTLLEDQKNAKELSEKVKDNWMHYYWRAEEAKSLEEKDKIYQEGLKKFPSQVELLKTYAIFLYQKKDFEKAEKYFLTALELEPNNAGNNGNYALILHNVNRDYEKAEKYYLKALELDPNHATNNGNYALFLSNKRKDYETAEKYYLKALELDPDHVNNNGNYAVFLNNIIKDYETAEKYYLKALKQNPNHGNINENYGIFLRNTRKEYETAEKYYLKALEVEPKNALYNANYASFLKSIKKDYETAETYYLKALEFESNHVQAIGSYAIFLNDIKKDYETAETYYLKALELDPELANNNANYAGFLLTNGKKEEAKKYIIYAYNFNPHNSILAEISFYQLAHFPSEHPECKVELQKLIKDGTRSIGWNFEDHLDSARKEQNSFIEFLSLTADILSKDIQVPEYYYNL